MALRAGETVGLIIVRQPDPERWNLERLRNGTFPEETALAQQGLGDWVTTLDEEDSR